MPRYDHYDRSQCGTRYYQESPLLYPAHFGVFLHYAFIYGDMCGKGLDHRSQHVWLKRRRHIQIGLYVKLPPSYSFNVVLTFQSL